MPDNRKALLVSTAPLTVHTKDGLAPLDLTLVKKNGLTVPAAAAAPFTVSRHATTGVSFDDANVRVSVPAAEDTAPVVTDGTVFWANVARDTDYQVAPTPTGIETFFTIRSAASPVTQRLVLDLPAGARLRRATSAHPIPGDPPQSVEMVSRTGQSLGFINPVSAVDTRGERVRASMRIDGSDVVLTVDHRGADIQYPVQVDPLVSVYSADSPNENPQEFWGWNWGEYLPNSYASQGVPDSHFGHALGDCAYYCGFYQSMPTNSFFTSGAFAQYTWAAPAGTYLQRAMFGNWGHTPFYSVVSNGVYNASTGWSNGMSYVNASGGTGPNPYSGSVAVSGATHTYCRTPSGTASSPTCAGGTPPDGETALLSLQAKNSNPNYVFTTSNKATSVMQYAYLFLGDRYNPTFPADGYVAPSSAWTNDGGAAHRIPASNARAVDTGLGVSSITFTGAQSGPGTLANGCNGDPARSPCPKDWSTSNFQYQLAEGVSTLSLTAKDAFGNDTLTPRTWTERIDRSGPTLDLYGGLAEHSGVLDGGEWTLHVDATDGTDATPASGVASISIQVDQGSPTVVTQLDCSSGDNCPLSADFSVDARTMSPGPHDITISATDKINNPRSTVLHITTAQTVSPSRCDGAPSYTPYYAGSTFNGMPVTHASRKCENEPGYNTHYETVYAYGDCAADDDQGCTPPLTITSSPLCERHAKLYFDELGNVLANVAGTLKSVPTATYDNGRLIEMYTGNTTVTISGETAALASSAADAIHTAVDDNIPSIGHPMGSLPTADLAAGAQSLTAPLQNILDQSNASC